MGVPPVNDHYEPSTSSATDIQASKSFFVSSETLSSFIGQNARASMDDISVPSFLSSNSNELRNFIKDLYTPLLAVKRVKDSRSATSFGYILVDDAEKLQDGAMAVVFVKKTEAIVKDVPLGEQIRVFSIDDNISYASTIINTNLFAYYRSFHNQDNEHKDYLHSSDVHFENAKTALKNMKKVKTNPVRDKNVDDPREKKVDGELAWRTDSEEEYDSTELEKSIFVPNLEGYLLKRWVHKERLDYVNHGNDESMDYEESPNVHNVLNGVGASVILPANRNVADLEDFDGNDADASGDEDVEDQPESPESEQVVTSTVSEQKESSLSPEIPEYQETSPDSEAKSPVSDYNEHDPNDEIVISDEDDKPKTPPRKRRNDQVQNNNNNVILINLESDDEDSAIVIRTPAKKRRRQVIESDEEDETEDIQVIKEVEASEVSERFINPMKRKQKSTVRAEKEERERIKRLASKQKTFNGIIFDDETTDLDQALTDSLTAGRSVKALLLDECDGKKVEVNPSLVHYLKEHQITGVQFLYNCAIESLDRLDMPGSGAILAHCMGLGKSLTTIAFVHTIMTHPLMEKKFNRILIVCPKNVVYNWENEFNKWIYKNNQIASKICFSKIDTQNQKTCLNIFKRWFDTERPTVIIIGYEKLRRLLMDEEAKPTKKNEAAKLKRKPKELTETEKEELEAMKAEFKKYLQDPGPDLIICDEAHTVKNVNADISKVMSKIRTKRRICLTGTPLQNNLFEYYTLINFVKPNLIGSLSEFKERFVIPIRNGQTIDATEIDLKTMRGRCLILYKKLKGTIDRQDYSILSQFLKPKHEYILQLRMTPKQLAMYKLFLSTCDTTKRSRKLFLNHHTFCRILLHPYQPITNWKEKKSGEKGSSSDEEDEDDAVSTQTDEQSTDANVDAPPSPPSPNPWFKDSDILSEEDQNNFELSYKLTFVIKMLKECEAIGDKMLIFSKSLSTLGLIRKMLESMSSTWFDDNHEAVLMNPNERWGWVKNKDYMFITGSVSCKDRNIIQERFNKQNSAQIRLCLISTKAGSLGTNFVAANRVIIFDQSWNPSHDRQAMFRTFRIGQTKPVYVYRLVGYGTMEDRIYMRQVTKESIASRVIDERQIKRHYKHSDMDELYTLQVNEYDPTKPLNVPSEDPLLANVVSKLKEAVVNILKHESLLKHIEEEALNEDEEKEAWIRYNEIENAKKATNKTQVNSTDQPSTSESTDQNGQAPVDNTNSV